MDRAKTKTLYSIKLSVLSRCYTSEEKREGKKEIGREKYKHREIEIGRETDTETETWRERKL